jgi:hypothetical protein
MKHQWSSGRIVPCHGTDPGSIPGWCMNQKFAGIAQLGERQTEDLKVACSIHAHRTISFLSGSRSFWMNQLGPVSLPNPQEGGPNSKASSVVAVLDFYHHYFNIIFHIILK